MIGLKSKRSKFIILISTLIVLIIICSYLVYRSKELKHYNYDEIPGGIDVVYKEDYVTFCANFYASGGVDYTGKVGSENHEIDPGALVTIPGETLLYIDDTTGLPCYRVYVYFTSCPWDMYFNSEYHSIIGSDLSYDGIPRGYVKGCNHRVVEFCYLNRDGSYVTLWKRGDTP